MTANATQYIGLVLIVLGATWLVIAKVRQGNRDLAEHIADALALVAEDRRQTGLELNKHARWVD